MIPALKGGIDHVHVYVPSRRAAAAWYETHLGFQIVEAFAFWTKSNAGPMTIADQGDRIHLALFKSDERKPVSLAFGASADEYLAWVEHLKAHEIPIRESDHTQAWSMYFDDPYGNQIEITSYEHDAVRSAKTGRSSTAEESG